MATLSARTIVLGYHTLGCLGLDALLRHGFEVGIVVTHRDAPEEEIWWESLAAKAAGIGIPVHVPESRRDPRIRDLIVAYEPDFIFSFHYRFLLPAEILSCAKRSALNLHSSLLPQYRGRAPVNWVLVNGETKTGVSLHHMVTAPDAGELVDQEAVSIDFEETPRSLYAKLEMAAARMLDRSLPLILAGTAPRRPLDLRQGSYFGGRKPEDGRVDWSGSALNLFFLVRGVTHPYPGAFTSMNGKRLYIWWGKPLELAHLAHPGTILTVSVEGCLVATGQGAFLITRCQLESDPEYDAQTFCHIHELRPGKRLGS